jgi:hypothetical protein
MALSPYGKRIIGEEQAAVEAATRATKRHLYGSRVVDAVIPEVAPAAVAARVVECVHTPTTSETIEVREDGKYRVVVTTCAECGVGIDRHAEKVDSEGSQLSVKEIEKALAENPAALDELLLAELERQDKRKGAFLAFREVESQRTEEAGGPRADILQMIDEQLALLAAK